MAFSNIDIPGRGVAATLVNRVCATGSEGAEHLLALADSSIVAQNIAALRQAGVLSTPPLAPSAAPAMLLAASSPYVPNAVSMTRLTEPWISALPPENPLLSRSNVGGAEPSDATPSYAILSGGDWSSFCSSSRGYQSTSVGDRADAASPFLLLEAGRVLGSIASVPFRPTEATASAKSSHRVRDLVDKALTALLPSDAATELASLLADSPALLLRASSNLTPETLPKLVDTNPGVAVVALRALAAVAPPSLLAP